MNVSSRLHRDWKLTANASLGLLWRDAFLWLTIAMLVLPLIGMLVGHLFAQAGYIDHDLANALGLIIAIAMFPVVHLAKALKSYSYDLRRRLYAQRQRVYFVIAPISLLMRRVIRPLENAARLAAEVMPLPGLRDINLTSRLLPIPRLHMGAAV